MRCLRVLVALDGSATSFRALAFALRRAAVGHDDVTLLAVLDTRVVLLESRAGSAHGQQLTTVGERMSHVLEQGANVARGSGVEVQSVLRPSGDQAAEIVRYAREGGFDEIVLGHREKRGVEKMVLGSTALRVLELADVPVTIVR